MAVTTWAETVASTVAVTNDSVVHDSLYAISPAPGTGTPPPTEGQLWPRGDHTQ